MTSEPRSLRELQLWLQAAVTANGDAQGEEAAAVATASRGLSAADRVGIYRRMIALRLRGALAEDHPALRHALGDDRFEDLVAAYVAASPSTSFTLADFGADFDAFLRGRHEIERRDALAELARLERAEHETFRAPRPPPLDPAAIAALTPGAWCSHALSLAPSLAMGRADHRVATHLLALRAGRCERGEHPRAGDEAWAVWRGAAGSWIEVLTQPAAAFLDACRKGASLADAIEALAERASADETLDVQDLLASALQRWAARDLFVAIAPLG